MLQYICAVLGKLDAKDHLVTLTASIRLKNLWDIYRVRDLNVWKTAYDVGDAAICHDYDNSGKSTYPHANEWVQDLNNAIEARQVEETILYSDCIISKEELVKYSGQNAQRFLNLTKAVQANIDGPAPRFNWNRSTSYASVAREDEAK